MYIYMCLVTINYYYYFCFFYYYFNRISQEEYFCYITTVGWKENRFSELLVESKAKTRKHYRSDSCTSGVFEFNSIYEKGILCVINNYYFNYLLTTRDNSILIGKAPYIYTIEGILIGLLLLQLVHWAMTFRTYSFLEWNPIIFL